MDKKKVAKFKKLLLAEKERIINQSRDKIREEITLSSDDLPDETDLAAIEVTQHLQFRLRDRERQLLSKINQALERIEKGEFGTCEKCEESIEERRLEARPVSTLCISCKEIEEHKEKVYA
jgi:DnaK suppressor protein